MPQKEQYGAQPPLELLRQWIDHGHWYDLKEMVKQEVVDVVGESYYRLKTVQVYKLLKNMKSRGFGHTYDEIIIQFYWFIYPLCRFPLLVV